MGFMYEKGALFLYSEVCTQTLQERTHMIKDNMHLPTLKEIETDLFRTLQITYAETFSQLLTELDQLLAENRDKSRFQLKDKRQMTMDSLFGSIEVKRNYYYDRESKKYVSLLDQHLQFEGAKGLSPLVQEMAMELAVEGQSYRSASDTLEKLLGYSVMSHESIRQHLLQTEVVPGSSVVPKRPVLFIEVDGLYVKRQKQRIKGREEKIVAIHEGWIVNGKRTKLMNKRHYVHQSKQPFWEGLESFLIDTYGYNPSVHFLVINGDGAPWITACRDYFKNMFFTLDRFHVARDLKNIFKGHSRYRSIRIKLARNNAEGLMTELNSAVGTMEDEKKEEALADLIRQYSQYPEVLGDYRTWLTEQGIDTSDMRPMGASESTMRVFAKRLKNGRSWSDRGIQAFIRFMIALKDGLDIKTLVGTMTQKIEDSSENKPPKFYNERLTSCVGEAVRNNISYLQQATGKPVYQALKGLQGF